MPDLSEIAAPFRSDARDIEDRPKLADAPLPPTDDRSAADWDRAAVMLIAERDSLAPPADTSPITAEQVERRIEALKAEARAYQADDPQ